MSIKINKIEEKPLLARKEIEGHVLFEGKATPSNDEIRKSIASEMKVKEDVIVVRHIYTAFGSSKADVFAYVYNTPEDLKRVEPKVRAKKGDKKEEEAGAEAPAK